MTSKRWIPAVLSVCLLLTTVVAHAQTARPGAKDEVVGMSRERLGRIAPVMTEQVEKGIFRLASMTKPIVTVAAMMLVERGPMKLNDPIATWLPELKDMKVETPTGDVAVNRPITVHDLMRHTAGFVYGGATKSNRIKQIR